MDHSLVVKPNQFFLDVACIPVSEIQIAENIVPLCLIILTVSKCHGLNVTLSITYQNSFVVPLIF